MLLPSRVQKGFQYLYLYSHLHLLFSFHRNFNHYSCSVFYYAGHSASSLFIGVHANYSIAIVVHAMLAALFGPYRFLLCLLQLSLLLSFVSFTCIPIIDVAAIARFLLKPFPWFSFGRSFNHV